MQAVGRWVAQQQRRVLIVGSGGLSHDPPVAALSKASPEAFDFMVSGRNPSPQARQAREEAMKAVSLGLGSYLSGLVGLYFAGIAVKKFLLTRSLEPKEKPGSKEIAA